MNDADRESYKRAVTGSAFETPEGRRLHHCFLGGIGADWDEDAVLDLLDRAPEAYLESSFIWGDGLAVYVDNKRYFFDTVKEHRD